MISIEGALHTCIQARTAVTMMHTSTLTTSLVYFTVWMFQCSMYELLCPERYSQTPQVHKICGLVDWKGCLAWTLCHYYIMQLHEHLIRTDVVPGLVEGGIHSDLCLSVQWCSQLPGTDFHQQLHPCKTCWTGISNIASILWAAAHSYIPVWCCPGCDVEVNWLLRGIVLPMHL